MIGFSNKKYLLVQQRAIEERMARVGRLYLEFGGKLLNDGHAMRTLPGYDPQIKLKLLKNLKKNLAVIYCISAKQLKSKKTRGDWGLTYDLAALRDLKELKQADLPVAGVVINRFEGENEAQIFARRLKRQAVKVFYRYEISNYPHDLDLILSRKGFGQDDHLKINKPLIVVWGAGGGSGKLSTCLGQIYNDANQKINSGYAKLETFPVWNLPLEHPVNVAYEASTADLGDTNIIDPFYLAAYGKTAVNYNRDIEAFPIIKEIFEKVLPKDNFCRCYQSPTEMGINLLKDGIIDDGLVKRAAKQEINFYLFRYRQEYNQGLISRQVLGRMNLLMKKVAIKETFLPPVTAARAAMKEAEKRTDKGDQGINCGAALQLPTGQIVSGKNSPLLYAEAAAILNTLKVLAGIDDKYDLITKDVINQVRELKRQIGEKSYSLTCHEALLALSTSAKTNPLVIEAQSQLALLRGCFLHTTHSPASGDMDIFRKLGVWVSTDGKIEKIDSLK